MHSLMNNHSIVHSININLLWDWLAIITPQRCLHSFYFGILFYFYYIALFIAFSASLIILLSHIMCEVSELEQSCLIVTYCFHG